MKPWGIADFELFYAISPIILTGGIASQMAGGMLPIVNITEAQNYDPLSGFALGADLDSYFAHYYPLPGGKAVSQDIGQYPFANQQTAANAVIAKPLAVSLMMICPIRGPGGYATKMAVLTGLQQTLQQHNISGGTYIIATPGLPYLDGVMLDMTDVTPSGPMQVQMMYQLDFWFPLVTQAAAAAAQNTLLSKISSGTMLTNPSSSGPQAATGAPASGLAPALIPSAQPSPVTGPALSQGGVGQALSTGTFGS